MSNPRKNIRIGLDRPEWLPRRFFLPLRIVTGLVIGIGLTGYGMALILAVESMIFETAGLHIGNVMALVLGAWVIKQTLQRMTCLEPDEEEEQAATPDQTQRLADAPALVRAYVKEYPNR